MLYKFGSLHDFLLTVLYHPVQDTLAPRDVGEANQHSSGLARRGQSAQLRARRGQSAQLRARRGQSAAQDSARPISTAQDSTGPISTAQLAGLGEANQRSTGQQSLGEANQGSVLRPIGTVVSAWLGKSATQHEAQYGLWVIGTAYDSKRGCFGIRARTSIE